MFIDHLIKNCCWRAGRWEIHGEAIKAYDEAIEINPQYEDAWDNKGMALSDQKKYDEAIQCFDNATEIDSLDAAAWYNKGVALNKLGRTAESDAAFAKAKELGYTGWSSSYKYI